jgi:hypothetical protein
VIGVTTKIDTQGFEALVAENKKRNVSLKGARAGGKVLQKAARAGAPKRKGSGALKQSQGVKAAKGRKGLTVSYAVQGARRKVDKMVTPAGRKKPMRVVPAFYDHLVQGGTKPHSVAKGQSLGRGQRVSKKGKVYGKSVVRTDQAGKQHPGAKANPYRRRAWDAVKDEAGAAALAAMAAETQKVIEKESAKILAKLSGVK